MPTLRNTAAAPPHPDQENRHDALRLALRRLNLGYMSRNFADCGPARRQGRSEP